MILALVIVPMLAGIGAFFVRADGIRRGLLLLAALAHAGMTASAWVAKPAPALGGWLVLDPIGLLFLSITSALFLAAAGYALGYLQREKRAAKTDFEEGFLFSNAPEATFTGCLLLFLAAMTLVTVSQHFGVLWVAVEATTLASAPLIYFHRHHRSLEATWKYLLICSVGIALALLGNFFLVVAVPNSDGHATPLVLGSLIQHAPQFHELWLKAAFLFLLVGYGTKMGLAPLHTWLPDAHSESPSVISALLSGALLNCAFVGILRAQQVCAAAGLDADAAAAKKAGYPGIVIPPTFPTCLMVSTGGGLMEIVQTLGINLGRLLHAEEDYEYFGSICEGDTISGRMKVVDMYDKEKKGRPGKFMEFTTIETEVRNQRGELVLKARSTMVER